MAIKEAILVMDSGHEVSLTKEQEIVNEVGEPVYLNNLGNEVANSVYLEFDSFVRHAPQNEWESGSGTLDSRVRCHLFCHHVVEVIVIHE